MKKGINLIIAIGKKPENKNMHSYNMDSTPDGTEMNNTVALGEGAYPSASDGDVVETKARGRIVIHDDGTKFLMVTETDGVPVKNINEEEGETSDEENSEDETTERPNHNLRADQAFDEYMKNNE